MVKALVSGLVLGEHFTLRKLTFAFAKWSRVSGFTSSLATRNNNSSYTLARLVWTTTALATGITWSNKAHTAARCIWMPRAVLFRDSARDVTDTVLTET